MIVPSAVTNIWQALDGGHFADGRVSSGAASGT
jgi:hypothetical protein